MKAIKRINNNVCLCIDSKGKEIVARGRGIGFHDFPYELDVKDVERTYYDVSENYISMINDIPEDIIDIATETIDYARNILENGISSNIVFTLADHINFTIERFKKNMDIRLPIIYDIQYLYKKEMDIGKYCLKLIKNKLKAYLPDDEAAYIALHIVNAEEKEKNEKVIESEKVIDDITDIIENDFNLKIDKNGFNYSRFVSHMQYLLRRGKNKELVKSNNQKIYENLKISYPETFECSQRISKYLYSILNFELTDEECIYLILHINRLCVREDCYQ